MTRQSTRKKNVSKFLTFINMGVDKTVYETSALVGKYRCLVICGEIGFQLDRQPAIMRPVMHPCAYNVRLCTITVTMLWSHHSGDANDMIY